MDAPHKEHAMTITDEAAPAVEIAGPIVEAIGRLHDLNARAQEHHDIIESCEWVECGVTPVDHAAAQREIALHHEVADLLVAYLGGFVPERSPAFSANVRAVLSVLMGTDHLAAAIYDPMRALSGIPLADVASHTLQGSGVVHNQSAVTTQPRATPLACAVLIPAPVQGDTDACR